LSPLISTTVTTIFPSMTMLSFFLRDRTNIRSCPLKESVFLRSFRSDLPSAGWPDRDQSCVEEWSPASGSTDFRLSTTLSRVANHNAGWILASFEAALAYGHPRRFYAQILTRVNPLEPLHWSSWSDTRLGTRLLVSCGFRRRWPQPRGCLS
jgi:hypothetical protein